MVGNGPFIVVDQFGYLPDSEKIAVIRNPVSGFDSGDSYSPGTNFDVVDTVQNKVVFTGAAQMWKAGTTDSSCGDKVWHFDFSSVTTPGHYLVRDKSTGTSSYQFDIGTDVYRDVLVQALRAFFYQRAGYAKAEPYAEAAWADGASHLGPLQDSHARLYSDPNNAATEKDLRGGWFDAGDYNKYSNWTAGYIVSFMYMYNENPATWTDDFNIPESGNGVPDVLDEAMWGLDWLKRMQNNDGSVLAIEGLDSASPPSAATGPSLYGSANTSATLSSAAAFALASKTLAGLNDPTLSTYLSDLTARAETAWNWAEANPDVEFWNNDQNAGTQGLGAGQQEVDANGRLMKKIEAAAYLFELTGDTKYRDVFDNNYTATELIKNGYASEFRGDEIRMLLHYADLPNATPSVASAIRTKFVTAMNDGNNWGAVDSELDPYMAHLGVYTWGSSSVKSLKGSLFYENIVHTLGSRSASEVRNTALAYLHYLQGVNPLGKVYLSNMAAHGAENSVQEFYHSWFSDGSALWDNLNNSSFGPAPGFVVGGPNPSYNWDSCCPNSCGSPANNALCGSAPPSPPFGQPPQKSYTDFNNGWPLDSWSVTENSDGYQVNYLRLLSKFTP